MVSCCCSTSQIIVRALGLVYPAQQSTQEELPFTDAAAIPQELRGYVFQAVKAGVLEGYPDNTFGGWRSMSVSISPDLA